MSKVPSARRSSRSLLACLIALAIFTWLDLASKDWAMAALSRQQLAPPTEVCVANAEGLVYPQRMQTAPSILVPDYLELRYAENCGAAFGVLNHGPGWLRLALFGPAAVAAALGLVSLYWTGYGGRLFAFSVPLIAAGALGNLVDRFRFGYVVDFIRFHLRDAFVWPTFNVADVTITVGVALLLIEGFIAPPSQPAVKRAAQPSPANRGASEADSSS